MGIQSCHLSAATQPRRYAIRTVVCQEPEVSYSIYLRNTVEMVCLSGEIRADLEMGPPIRIYPFRVGTWRFPRLRCRLWISEPILDFDAAHRALEQWVEESIRPSWTSRDPLIPA